MSSDAYQLLSRAMRYVFVLIAALFFLMTVIWMRRDQRHWRRNKKDLPDAGTVGELVDEDSLRRCPVPREGTLGSSARCDIRIVGRGVRRHHADVRFVDGRGLRIIPGKGRKIFVDGQAVSSPVYAARGAHIRIGSVYLTLRLFEGVDAPAGGVYGEDGGFDPLMTLEPGAEGWSRVMPLPEDRIVGDDEEESAESGYTGGFDEGVPFDSTPVMHDGGREEDDGDGR